MSKRGYIPTTDLRFVKRLEPHDATIMRYVRILQQRWTSVYVGEPDEWRDVPEVSESEAV